MWNTVHPEHAVVVACEIVSVHAGGTGNDNVGRESGCCLVVERNRYLLPDVGAVGGITLDNLLAVGDCRCIGGVVHEGAYVGCISSALSVLQRAVQ